MRYGVVLSYDHATIRALDGKVDLLLTPLGVGDRLADWGIVQGKIQQFDWWQGIEVDGLQLTATPAQHFSGRGLADGNRTLWASWIIEDDGLRVFFSGDTGYFDGFAEIGQRFGPFDMALASSGAAGWSAGRYKPRQPW